MSTVHARVTCAFVSPAGRTIEVLRMPIVDPQLTVRQAAMDALLRFSKTHSCQFDTTLAITEVTADGESVLFPSDRLLEAMDPTQERLFLKLNTDITAERRTVAYVAKGSANAVPLGENTMTMTNQSGSRPVLPHNAGTVPPSNAPSLRRFDSGTADNSMSFPVAPPQQKQVTTVVPVPPSQSAQSRPEPSMDLVSAAAPPPAARSLLLTKEELHTPRPRGGDRRSESPKPTPTADVADGKQSKKVSRRNLSDIPCPMTQHPPAAKSRTRAERAKTSQETPEEARLVEASAKLKMERASNDSGLGWTANSHQLFPTNYRSDPDGIVREIRKRKREEKAAAAAAAAATAAASATAAAAPASCLSKGSTKSKTVVAKVVTILEEAKAVKTETRGSAHDPIVVADELDSGLLRKSARAEEPPNVIRSLFHDVPPTTCGGFSVGQAVDARLNGGCWYPAYIVHCDVPNKLFKVMWDNATQSTDLIMLKDLKERAPAKLPKTSPATVAVTPPSQIISSPVDDVAVGSQAQLGWGECADRFFDASTYVADPGKAHLYLDKSVLDAPRQRRAVVTPPIFKSGMPRVL